MDIAMKQEQTYPDIKMFIDGTWCDGSRGKSEAVLNPATGLAIGNVPHASVEDLDRALDSAWRGFGA